MKIRSSSACAWARLAALSPSAPREPREDEAGAEDDPRQAPALRRERSAAGRATSNRRPACWNVLRTVLPPPGLGVAAVPTATAGPVRPPPRAASRPGRTAPRTRGGAPRRSGSAPARRGRARASRPTAPPERSRRRRSVVWHARAPRRSPVRRSGRCRPRTSEGSRRRASPAGTTSASRQARRRSRASGATIGWPVRCS